MERELAMRYRTPEALGMAVTAAARRSGMDVGRAISSFYFHRLLCRVFSVPDSPFLLKGGQSMLARTSSARATRDIDLLSREADLGAALSELRELASLDLGDFVRFEFAGSKPIKAKDEYRSGLKVTFVPLLGARRLQPVSVDLVVDQIPCGEPELLTPADRIEVEGVPVFDYRVYPVANSIADKLCGIIETHGGRPSSRVKDLVDLLIYTTNEDLDGDELCHWCRLEARVRGIELPPRFSVPGAWRKHYSKNFEKLVRGTELDVALSSLDAAERLAARMLDPVLSGEARGSSWDCRLLDWVRVHP